MVERRWDKGYWLTPPRQSFLPSSQSGLLPQRRPCYYQSREPSQSAASGPRADLALFSQTYRWKQGKHIVSPTETHTHTRTHLITTGCYAINTHKAFEDGTFRAISSFTNDPRHLWRQSNNHPARPQTFKHGNFAPTRSAKLMSWITMKSHWFFSTSSAVEENLKPQITSTASYNAERESVPECLT